MFYIRIVTIALGAAIGIAGARAETSVAVDNAVKQLRRTANYSWTRTVETPGAPFMLAPSKGRTDLAGFAVQVLRADGKTVQIVTKGHRSVVKAGSAWISSAEIAGAEDVAFVDAKELLNAKVPADELALLLTKVGAFRPDSDGAYTGVLDAGTAQDAINALLKSRAPRPMEATGSYGTLRVWLKGGLPEKYVLSVGGVVSLPFGKKEVKKISTVIITDIGSTIVDVPPGAKEKLEAIQ